MDGLLKSGAKLCWSSASASIPFPLFSLLFLQLFTIQTEIFDLMLRCEKDGRACLMAIQTSYTEYGRSKIYQHKNVVVYLFRSTSDEILLILCASNYRMDENITNKICMIVWNNNNNCAICFSAFMRTYFCDGMHCIASSFHSAWLGSTDMKMYTHAHTLCKHKKIGPLVIYTRSYVLCHRRDELESQKKEEISYAKLKASNIYHINESYAGCGCPMIERIE